MANISELQTQLKKEHGEKFITQPDEVIDVDRAPTGVYPLDYAMGGGFPRGKYSVIWGPESSGKTNLALKALAMNQFLEPEKKAVFIDVEHSFDQKWAQMLGVDINPKRLAVIQPHYAEQAVDILQMMLAAEDIGCLVFDSVGAMVTTNEEESTANKQAVGGAALLITKMYKKMMVGFSKAATEGRYPTVIFINQMRAKIGVMFGSPDDMPGGKAFRHGSAMTLKVYGKDEIDTKINPDRPAFKKITGQIVKQKCPTLSRTFEVWFPVINQGGLKIGHVPDWNTIGNQLKDLGWMSKEGKKVVCFGEEFGTYKAVKEHLYADHALIQSVRDKIMEARMEEIYGVEAEADEE
jgi:recombination protein RecA